MAKKIDEKTRSKILNSIKTGTPVGEVTKTYGVSRAVIYRWKQETKPVSKTTTKTAPLSKPSLKRTTTTETLSLQTRNEILQYEVNALRRIIGLYENAFNTRSTSNMPQQFIH